MTADPMKVARLLVEDARVLEAEALAMCRNDVPAPRVRLRSDTARRYWLMAVVSFLEACS